VPTQHILNKSHCNIRCILPASEKDKHVPSEDKVLRKTKEILSHVMFWVEAAETKETTDHGVQC
jgi:hypothetical protein